MACDRVGRARPDLGADGVGEDAGRVPVGDRQVGDRGTRRRAADRPRVRLSAEGALLRHRPQPPRAPARDRRRPEGRRPDRRHAPARAPGDAARTAGHPDHDARVAVPDADRPGAGVVRGDRVVHRRRDPRGGVDQARGASGADARAVDRGGRRRGAADRPLGHAESARGDRPLPGRAAPDLPAGRHRNPQGARPANHGPRRLHGRAGCDARSRSRSASRQRGDPAVDLAGDLPRAGRAGQRRTARRSCSSTTAAAPSGSRSDSTSWPSTRSRGPITARSRARSAKSSKRC